MLSVLLRVQRNVSHDLYKYCTVFGHSTRNFVAPHGTIIDRKSGSAHKDESGTADALYLHQMSDSVTKRPLYQ